MEDNVMDGQEATPAEAIEETADQETPEVEQQEASEASGEEKKEESQEESAFDEEGYKYALEKYGDQLEGAPKEAIALMGRRELQQSSESSRVARENRSLKRRLARLEEEIVEEPDRESEEPIEVQPDAVPPVNIQKLQTSLGRVQQKQQVLSNRYQSTRQQAADAHEELVEAKINLRNATEALEKQEARLALAHATQRYNNLVEKEGDIQNEFAELMERGQELQEQIANEDKRLKQQKQEEIRETKAREKRAKRYRREVEETAYEVMEELNVPIENESKFFKRLEMEIALELDEIDEKNPGAGYQDLSKLTRDVLTKQFGSKKSYKKEGQAKVAAINRLRGQVPTPPSTKSPESSKQPMDRAAALAAFEAESVRLFDQASQGGRRR